MTRNLIRVLARNLRYSLTGGLRWYLARDLTRILPLVLTRNLPWDLPWGLTRSLAGVLRALSLALEGELERIVGFGLGGLAVRGSLFVLLGSGRRARGFVGELALALEVAFYHAAGDG